MIMYPEIYERCITACLQCSLDCEQCYVACVGENKPELSPCILLDRDCADICLLAAQLMSRGSNFAPALCNLCAEICEACAGECLKHEHMDHCRMCAESCRLCADECRKISL